MNILSAALQKFKDNVLISQRLINNKCDYHLLLTQWPCSNHGCKPSNAINLYLSFGFFYSTLTFRFPLSVNMLLYKADIFLKAMDDSYRFFFTSVDVWKSESRTTEAFQPYKEKNQILKQWQRQAVKSTKTLIRILLINCCLLSRTEKYKRQEDLIQW